jgi:hypothetical protein
MILGLPRTVNPVAAFVRTRAEHAGAPLRVLGERGYLSILER